MVPQLKAFYYKFLLPELALPRYGTYTGIRQPKSPWFEEVAAVTYPKKPCQQRKPTCKTKSRRKSNQCEQPVVVTSQIVQHGTNKTVLQEPSTSNENVSLSQSTSGRSRRSRHVKLVGRKILHEWCVCDKKKKGKNKWFSGIVLDVVKGKDGDPKAVYEVLYEGEDAVNEVDHLHDDFIKGSLKFDDI